MRWITIAAAVVLGAAAALFAPGCGGGGEPDAAPANGSCRTPSDCAAQQNVGRVCVDGRCQECGGDGDCKDGFVCRTNHCLPKPQCAKDPDCPEGWACRDYKCIASPDERAVAP